MTSDPQHWCISISAADKAHGYVDTGFIRVAEDERDARRQLEEMRAHHIDADSWGEHETRYVFDLRDPNGDQRDTVVTNTAGFEAIEGCPPLTIEEYSELPVNVAVREAFARAIGGGARGWVCLRVPGNKLELAREVGRGVRRQLEDTVTNERRRLAALQAMRAAGQEIHPWLGMPTGTTDCRGALLHVGDTLDFDEREWGGPYRFTIGFEQGELTHGGTFGDLSEWCTLVSKWDEGVAVEEHTNG